MPERIPHSRFYGVRTRLEHMAVLPGWRGALFEFAVFVFKQGWACLNGWHLVPPEKLGSWYLLMIISFVLVSFVARVREPRQINREDTASAPQPRPVRQGL